MKYSKTLERFLSAHEGKLIWVILKESSDTILGKLIEFEDNIVVLNIVEREGESMEVTDVILLFDLDSVFGFTAGEESLEIFKKAIEEGRQVNERLRSRMDEKEIA